MTGTGRRYLALVAIVAMVTGGGCFWARTDVGHAAGTPVASARLSIYRPSALPPVCPGETVTASADTWVNQQAGTTNYGTDATMSINVRNGRRGRVLVKFPLPAVPATCTLASATLRLFNSGPTTGRTISAYRAGAAWVESGATGVTFATVPGEVGTAADTAASAGWMDWAVTTHVQALYAGTDDGFLLRDATEGGTTEFIQVFSTREGTNPPQLVLQWQAT